MDIKPSKVADTLYQPFSRSEQPWHITGGLILSICLHVGLLLQLSHINLPDAKNSHQVKFIEVQLVHIAAAQEMPQDTSAEAPEPEKDIQEEPFIEQEKPKQIKKEVIKPKVVKKPVNKRVKKKVKPHPVKKVTHTQKLLTSNHASSNTAVKVQAPSNNQAQLKQMRQQYLSRIISIIQSHKRYPYSARRRHIEGDVRVSFVIDVHGNISALHIVGGSSVLRLSTRRAIEDSLPFPAASEILSQSIHSQFVMQYRLK